MITLLQLIELIETCKTPSCDAIYISDEHMVFDTPVIIQVEQLPVAVIEGYNYVGNTAQIQYWFDYESDKSNPWKAITGRFREQIAEAKAHAKLNAGGKC